MAIFYIFFIFIADRHAYERGKKTHFGLAKAIKNSIFDSKYSEYLKKKCIHAI